MFYLFIISMSLFLITCIIHLYYCFKEIEKNRKITKCFLMPLLMLILISVKCESILLYLALTFSTIGDIFLIRKEKKPLFVIGAIAFLLTHVCYLVFMHNELVISVSTIWYVIMCISIIVLLMVFIKILSKHFKKLTPACFIYALVLLLELTFSIIAIKTNKACTQYIMIFGFSLFILSDSILAYTKFVKDVKRRDFYIMGTYVSAQIAIIFSLLSSYLH